MQDNKRFFSSFIRMIGFMFYIIFSLGILEVLLIFVLLIGQLEGYVLGEMLGMSIITVLPSLISIFIFSRFSKEYLHLFISCAILSLILFVVWKLPVDLYDENIPSSIDYTTYAQILLWSMPAFLLVSLALFLFEKIKGRG